MLHRVTVVTTGLLITPGETESGYTFAPYDRARAYDALALRLNGVLNDVFNYHYPFTEDLREPFDQADPIGLICSPWIDASDFNLAKDKVEKEVSDFLPFVEFARAGRARPFAYVIESMTPGQATPSIRIAPVRYPYKGNHIRGWGNEIGVLCPTGVVHR